MISTLIARIVAIVALTVMAGGIAHTAAVHTTAGHAIAGHTAVTATGTRPAGDPWDD
jgi:hypothetical protein